MLPGVQRRAAADPGDLARPHRGDEPGPQDRRLAAARGADHGQQPSRAPAARSAPRRRPRGRRSSRGPRPRRPAGRGTGTPSLEAGALTPGPLTAWIRSGAATPSKTMRPEVDQLAAVGQVPADELGRHRGEEDLAAVCLLAEPGGEVDRRSEVVGPPTFRLAGVEAEAGGDRRGRRPVLGRQRTRGRERAAASAAGAESNTDIVESPSPIDLRNRPPCASTQSAISSSCRTSASAIAAGSRLPHRDRALDVRHAERDDAGRQRLGPARPEAFDQLAGRGRPALRSPSPCPSGSPPRAARPAPVRCPPRPAAPRPAPNRSAGRTPSLRGHRCRWRATARHRRRAPAHGSPGCRCAGAARSAPRTCRSRRA